MRTVKMYRIGSDPEALAVHLLQTTAGKRTPVLLGATQLVGDNRELTLRSFIGCDGHAATMELRPPPCNNVQWHLTKLATGLSHIRVALGDAQVQGSALTALLAQPNLGRETCGGHIWVSLYYRSKLAEHAVNYMGVIFDNQRGDLIRSNQSYVGADVDSLPRNTLQKYRDLAYSGDEISTELCWRKLHYLLFPLEKALFGGARRAREDTVSDQFVRLPSSQRIMDPGTPIKPGFAYFRFEYRYPSTWLSHPTMALTYLGLAKLAILNWDILPSLPQMRAADGEVVGVDGMKKSGWASVLRARLKTLTEHPDFRQTPDLAGLTEALNTTLGVKLSFPLYVDFDAWMQYTPH